MNHDNFKKTEYFCPSCGCRNVYEDWASEDFYQGTTHTCAACTFQFGIHDYGQRPLPEGLDRAGIIKAPFTEAQAAALNRFQNREGVHPFTCGDCRQVLVAQVGGWKCPDCSYTQDWAHEFMARGNL